MAIVCPEQVSAERKLAPPKVAQHQLKKMHCSVFPLGRLRRRGSNRFVPAGQNNGNATVPALKAP